MTIEEIYALPVNQYGWRVLPTGNYVTLGYDVKLGNGVKLGDGVTLGDDGLDFQWPPLQIQGSKHLLYVAGPVIIGVGCVRETAAWWMEHYKDVGHEEGYTDSQTEEYKQWLDIAIAYQSKLPQAVAK